MPIRGENPTGRGLPMADIAVGIDLGTSNSCVAVSLGGQVDILPNARGESTIASVVNLDAEGRVTVGNDARAAAIRDPENTIVSSKRLIGRYFFSEEVGKARSICAYPIVEGENHGVRVQVRDEVWSLPEVSAMLLRELVGMAEARLESEVKQAVVTVPAYFNDNQRQATVDAARIAGIEVLRVLNEPTAAALAYGFGRGLEQRVAVYDLGGGTFDVSVLDIRDDVFEVLATSGDTFLGGDDFDDRIIDLIADEFLAAEGINLRNDRGALEQIKFAAEAAKRELSLEDAAEIRLPGIIQGPDGEPRSIERTLGAEEFSSLVMDLVQRTFKVCDEALQRAGVVVQDLDGVILVGGPTRLPLIRDTVRQYFQQEPRADVDPDEVVALGAAIQAASLTADQPAAFLLDVTPRSLQIGVAGGLAETVIERNTPVPIEQTRIFTTLEDHQESVAIRVYQGESREASDNELLGEFEFSGFQTGPRTDVAIEVGFDIDTDGILSVRARDNQTGEESSTRITLTSGLSESELQELLDRDVTARVRSNEKAANDASPASLPAGRETSTHEAASSSAGDALSQDLSEPDPDAIDLVAEDDCEAGDLQLGPVEEDLASCDDVGDAVPAAHAEAPSLEREVVGVHEPSGPIQPGDEAAER